MIFCHLLIFFKLIYMIVFKKILSGTLLVSKDLDPDQDRLICLYPNSLQWLSADDKSHR